MFSVHCPRHGSSVLLDEDRVTRLDGSGGRLTVHWVCWCGYEGSHRTGRRRPQPADII